MSSTDYSKLETPTMCYVDFCLVPVRPLFFLEPLAHALHLV